MKRKKILLVDDSTTILMMEKFILKNDPYELVTASNGAEAIEKAVETFYAGANPDPRRLIGSRVLVVKTARPGERGVLVVDYSYVFPLMAGLFDLAAIADRYTLVLEPSWAAVSVQFSLSLAGRRIAALASEVS